MMPTTIREVRDNGDGTLTVQVAVTVLAADLKIKSGKDARKKANKTTRLAAIKAAVKKAVA